MAIKFTSTVGFKLFLWLKSETRNMSFAFGEGSINNDILHGEARPDFQIDKSSQIRKSKSTTIIKRYHKNR